MLDIGSIPGVSAAEAMRNGDNDDLLEDVAQEACEDLCDEADDDDEWLCC